MIARNKDPVYEIDLASAGIEMIEGEIDEDFSMLVESITNCCLDPSMTSVNNVTSAMIPIITKVKSAKARQYIADEGFIQYRRYFDLASPEMKEIFSQIRLGILEKLSKYPNQANENAAKLLSLYYVESLGLLVPMLSKALDIDKETK